MNRQVLSEPQSAHPTVRRELVDLLYTAFPQVLALCVTSAIVAVTLTLVTPDPVYALTAVLIVVIGAGRLLSLWRYPRRAALSDRQVVYWERVYGIGAASFGSVLGLLASRALQIGDLPGAWLAFGLSMSFCVGMVSRAAVRPWVVSLTSGLMLAPILVTALWQPEIQFKVGAVLVVLFWTTMQEASRHLSSAFIERLESRQALAQRANQDFLTGLPNRAAFLSALGGATGHFTIVAIDLDGFKPINDKHGHLTGDELLRQVATRLRQCVAERGLAARFGGDEFMLLQYVHPGQSGRDEAATLARNAITALSLPFHVIGLSLRIGASAGVIVTDHKALAATCIEAVLDQADHALYVAKRAGGGCWNWGDHVDDGPGAVVQRLSA
ncbi:MAG: GGDEF domain-containing protein [Rhodopseudomonas palustris]|nr:MAG: GGDEF domain-containing protein [Rhodopseudomonas palustris]